MGNHGVPSSNRTKLRLDDYCRLNEKAGCRLRKNAIRLLYICMPFTDLVVLEVVDEAALDTLLQYNWAGMKAALVAGDVDGAQSFHYQCEHERYSAIYNESGSDLPSMVQQIRTNSPIIFEGFRFHIPEPWIR